MTRHGPDPTAQSMLQAIEGATVSSGSSETTGVVAVIMVDEPDGSEGGGGDGCWPVGRDGSQYVPWKGQVSPCPVEKQMMNPASPSTLHGPAPSEHGSSQIGRYSRVVVVVEGGDVFTQTAW